MSAMGLGENVRERLFELVKTVPPAQLMFALRDFAREVLAQEYPREQLLEDFEVVLAELRGVDERREDAVMEVMDFLYGWSSSHMKL
jgi:hypothetical protein